MAARVNHRGWIVLTSIESDDRALCLDIFEDPNGGFGFEHFRADPEDRGRWTPIGGFSASRYDTASLAAQAAQTAVPWLARHPTARRSLDAWLSSAGIGPHRQP